LTGSLSDEFVTDYSPEFKKAASEVILAEGGLVDDPRDPGGRTKYGITQSELDGFIQRNPGCGLPARVDDLTPAAVLPIYKIDYWDAFHGDQLPPALASVVFKQYVNEPPHAVITALQTAVGVLSDGVMGPRTVAAAARQPTVDTVAMFLAECVLYYMVRPGWGTFGRGWVKRCFVDAMDAVT
jgi:lysozyme family protein